MKRKVVILLSFFIIMLIVTGCQKKINIFVPKEEIIESEIVYGCDTGDTLNDSNMCVKQTNTIATFRYVCPSGYNLVGGQCWKSGGVLNLSKCGANHVEVNGYCYINTVATMEYYCVSGTLQGMNCVTEYFYAPNITYICPEGYTLNENNKCKK